MAFDQSTRNRLQKFVNDARILLTEEFTRQLQATYGLDPNAGSVAALESLTHLDNRQRQTARILRDTLEHYLTTTPGKGEADRIKQVLSRIVREQAFTVLNRLSALRMAEARGFLLESIARGYNAKGFQLYKQLSGSAQGETGEAYRNYLYSVFDEFSIDLAVLFDRHSAQGKLFPREPALLELIELINHHEIKPLWGEDETIGWVYQYFNSQEERRQMRAESQAPRNSRELAVRNQFFTPRYVVEFLTDNTLGRIWYEMTEGSTGLIDSCRYLVRRPTEIFLKLGQSIPELDETEKESLSQEDLLKQPVYISYRAIKDPRCIRMLDPACGSMHFGLYAFDLFERIYEEAWQLESEFGAEIFAREGELVSLHKTYESFEDFKSEIPRLIIEHNIHGVDIDPRAVQIAGLSLWQRAQRSWQQQGIKPQHRPVVRKSNIICAEPMGGEKELLQEFACSLNPPVLGQLLEAIFDKMELASEAGTLLKIEEEIQSSIHKARGQWQERSGSNTVGDMLQGELDKAISEKKLGFDLRGVDDESFWDRAEQLILESLSKYADKAESDADQKRLFAEDAAKGFAFIDLCRKRFDVMLQNPPFGEPTKESKAYVKKFYPSSSRDILQAFVERLLTLSVSDGVAGTLSARTGFFLGGSKHWRSDVVFSNRLELFADLGLGVLDDALVEVAAYVVGKGNPDGVITYATRHLSTREKEIALSEDVNKLVNDLGKGSHFVSFDRALIQHIPDFTFAYWAPRNFINRYPNTLNILDSVGKVKCGVSTADDFRFVRLSWEVNCNNIGKEKRWVRFSKGGEYSPPYDDIHLLVDWGQGHQLRAFPGSNIRNEDTYFYPGATYTVRTASAFGPKILPKDCIYSHNAQSWHSNDEQLIFSSIA
ncbi:MAG: BREX-1 system adenine-specific DNA-methyltransferase PglX, partial [Gammaproteobacteria bacterium]|nr:BREX-1 system adenine-specific DNA-methyltransferase PglX [Gammaproteobacteria bacterium]